ncbi:MAG TPA: rhomboid family intramembrane serine protease [Anaeromyxobacteraceae bacterium]|nr:rhomboid family intramembrane serine protease [Anaeromyxobacteraceae bacterium]
MFPLKADTPVRKAPAVTVALLAANVLGFAWQAWFAWKVAGLDRVHGLPAEEMMRRLDQGLSLTALIGGAIPWEVVTLRDIGPVDLVPPPFTILTSMFLHGGLFHLLGNLLFLWVFGPSVEDVLGRMRFLAFYVASGIAAAAAQVLLSLAQGDPLIPMVGASGAIAGVMAAYLVFFPRARVTTAIPIVFIVRIVHLPAAFFIGVWFALQLLYAVVGGSGSGVAFFAHVGGFVFGWVVTKALVLAHLRRRRASGA